MLTGLVTLLIVDRLVGTIYLVTWHSRKTAVVTCSSAKAEYLAYTTCELIWIQLLLLEMGVVSFQFGYVDCQQCCAS